MSKTIFLLAPVFVSLFWSFALMSGYSKQAPPRRFLHKFMLLTALVFFAHFLYFTPEPDAYIFFDLPLQFAGLILFPLLHFYFRLLTVDHSISFKAHARFLILPVFVFLFYGIAVFNSPIPVYKAWLFGQSDYTHTAPVQFLDLMRRAIQLTFLFQVAYFTVVNHLLIRKFASVAEQFYSDVRDAKTGNAKMLNYFGIALGAISLILFGIGRAFLLPENFLVSIGWSLFTVALFKFGELGMRQKMINPSPSQPQNVPQPLNPVQLNEIDQSILIHKILSTFRENKLYLQSNLSIMDVVQAVGSNRTSISSAINQEFDQNFCVFVNGFRAEELGHIVRHNPGYTMDEYASRCGFGSVNSMKRSVLTFYGKSFIEFRSSRLKKTPA